jgi:hypothetical protein
MWPYDSPHHNPFIQRIDEAWAARFFPGSTLKQAYTSKLKDSPMELTTLRERVVAGYYIQAAMEEKGALTSSIRAPTGDASASASASTASFYAAVADKFFAGLCSNCVRGLTCSVSHFSMYFASTPVPLRCSTYRAQRALLSLPTGVLRSSAPSKEGKVVYRMASKLERHKGGSSSLSKILLFVCSASST